MSVINICRSGLDGKVISRKDWAKKVSNFSATIVRLEAEGVVKQIGAGTYRLTDRGVIKVKSFDSRELIDDPETLLDFMYQEGGFYSNLISRNKNRGRRCSEILAQLYDKGLVCHKDGQKDRLWVLTKLGVKAYYARKAIFSSVPSDTELKDIQLRIAIILSSVIPAIAYKNYTKIADHYNLSRQRISQIKQELGIS